MKNAFSGENINQLLDPVIFAEKVLNFKPFPYQAQLLRDASKRIVICAGRQVGKSTTIAVKALHFAATNPATTTLIVSASLRQSMLMFDKILDFVEASLLKKSVTYRSRTRLRFTNRSWIIALPAGRYGATLRGHTAHLIILDEAAFIPVEVIENVVFPMLATTGGSCWMLSTPWGLDHTFYRVWNSPDWSKHHWPSSVNPLISQEFLMEQRRLIGERFRMEYLAEFVAEEDSFFPIALLRSCIEDFDAGLEPGLSWGYDPGGKSSLAAVIAVKEVGDRYYVVFHKTFAVDSYVDVDNFLADMHRRYPFSRLVFDKTGIGGPLEEHLRSLALPIEPVVLTQNSVQELMFNAKTLLEQKRLILPPSPELLNHLNAVVAKKTWSGRHSFQKRAGAYDDLAYALALALLPRTSGTRVAAIPP
ncbi:MAG: terminase family protein [candidate division WOR-3 bacterium]